jgi:LPXTG-motif cell wall-anchored protein
MTVTHCFTDDGMIPVVVVEEFIETNVPKAPPVLPKTGELPPYFAYGFGSLLVLAGLFMKRKF